MIKCENLTKVYSLKKTKGYRALMGVDLEVKTGDFAAIMGPSGCGKSTLLNILGFLDNPSEGRYLFKDRDVGSFSDADRSLLRRKKIGFVFQSFNLLPRFSALENVRLPMLYLGMEKYASTARARELLVKVGLQGKEENSPLELSGGERQRVGVARALANSPELLLADEPTGNLDSRTGLDIITLLRALNSGGLTIIMVTHDVKLAEMASRMVKIVDGKVVE
jgi:putative ABC transport system ATP-binding protein